MCFGCSKEPSQLDCSFEHPQHMFWLRNKKNDFQLRTLIYDITSSSTLLQNVAAKHCKHRYTSGHLTIVNNVTKCGISSTQTPLHIGTSHHCQQCYGMWHLINANTVTHRGISPSSTVLRNVASHQCNHCYSPIPHRP